LKQKHGDEPCGSSMEPKGYLRKRVELDLGECFPCSLSLSFLNNTIAIYQKLLLETLRINNILFLYNAKTLPIKL